MKFSVFVAILLFSFASFGLQLQYLNQFVLPHRMDFQKSKIGGLSGLFYDSSQQKLYAVSDDRGIINEPRIYELKLQIGAKDFKVEPMKVIFLTVNESQLSHKSSQSPSKLFSKVLDLEGISMTPWGDFLLANEGDNNKKPRVNPQLISAQPSGTLMREFEIPKEFLPEPTGQQKTGVQNNLAFEGLAANPNGKEWMLATEAALVQDPKTFVRFISYAMPEAWVLKPGKQYRYPMTEGKMDPGAVIEFQKGVSEIHYINDHELLVLERLLQVKKTSFQLQIQLYQTDLKQIDKDGLLKKTLVLDFARLEPQIGRMENFEGMTWGPVLPDGRRSLIVVSDDNFMRQQRTQFLLFAVDPTGRSE